MGFLDHKFERYEKCVDNIVAGFAIEESQKDKEVHDARMYHTIGASLIKLDRKKEVCCCCYKYSIKITANFLIASPLVNSCSNFSQSCAGRCINPVNLFFLKIDYVSYLQEWLSCYLRSSCRHAIYLRLEGEYC